MAGALNELAGETLVQSHHGSIARAQRVEIEDALKSGRLPALVATSSLELGIDMGAIDLVIQIEAPPSIASGMQRIGRASHQVGAESQRHHLPEVPRRPDRVRGRRGGDARRQRSSRRATRAIRSTCCRSRSWPWWRWTTGPSTSSTPRSAPPRRSPSCRASRSTACWTCSPASTRPTNSRSCGPRLTWDRVANTLTARQGAKRVAITSGGTIPDRGLYGVFLAGTEKNQSARVGELDEEMVFEASRRRDLRPRRLDVADRRDHP